ncbi:hypothetical protein BDY24DRAFT_415386 [Mrakia frigida]|uniref:uncharacterized protein n=1 Tax=Mrakia frigida TaxID=29902 RepID=UPI003FCC15DA
MSSSSSATNPPNFEAPFKIYTPAEQAEITSTETAAKAAYQKWKDAKAAGEDTSVVQGLLEEAEKKDTELKGLQSLC